MTLRGIRSDRIRALARQAIEQGFTLRQDHGHPALVASDGQRIWFSGTNVGGRGDRNFRAELMRHGFRPPDRSEVATMQAEPTKHAVPGGGFTFAPKGKSIAADDVIIGGQPFRIRTNADGSVNATTLRRPKQRSWQSKSGDVLRLRRTLADFAASVEPWETPMPDGYVNGSAGPARSPEVQTPVEVITPELAVELEQHTAGDYPIASALDNLERVVGPAILALEWVGKNDAAALLRSELAMTPAEVELLALYRETRPKR